MDIGTLAQWAGATATSIAVVVALFKEELVGRWRCPKLPATVSLRAPDCTETPIFLGTGEDTLTFDCYYFRIWIENTGNQRGESLQVYADKLLKKHADGVFRGIESF